MGFAAWLRGLRGRPDVAAPGGEAPAAFDLIFGAPARSASRDARGDARGMELAARRGTVVIIGNCVAETVADCLAGEPLAAGAFRFVGVPTHQKPLDGADVQSALAVASHVFVQSCAAKLLPAVVQAAPADAAIIRFPDPVLRSLWPFDAQNGYGDAAVVVNETAVIRHPDGALALLRGVEPDKRKRFELYRDLNFEMARGIERIAAAQRRFQAKMDEGNEAELGGFMAARFADTQLFYNSTHPAPAVFQSLCEFFWRKLELSGRLPLLQGLDRWRDWSVPVHPAVARRLGADWVNEKTRYRYCTLGEVTWEEWVRAYIEMCG